MSSTSQTFDRASLPLSRARVLPHYSLGGQWNESCTAPSMDCFHDFCLVCDKQCVDAVYCSQSCRLADLERANRSALPSPASINDAAWSSVMLDRTTTKTSTTISQPALKRSATESQAQTSRLQSSVSRSSLISNASTTSSGMTEQAHLELQEYFSLFDQTRAAKRRSSVR